MATVQPTKSDNFKNNFKNPRTRMVWLSTFMIIVIILVVLWLALGRSNRNSQKELDSKVQAPPTMGATTGMQGNQMGQASPEYDRLVQAGNVQDAEHAEKVGGSSIPIPRTGIDSGPIPVGPQPVMPQPIPVPPPPTTATTQDPNAAVTARQQEIERRRQEWEQRVNSRTSAMKAQLGVLQKYWEIQPHQRFDVETNTPKTGEAQSTTGTTTSGQSVVTTQSEGQSVKQPTPDIKMGDLMYATLDFGINTDDPTSAQFVQATIHQSGPFNGAKVIGSLQEGDQYAKTVGVHFTQMRVPGEAEPRTIDAWAVSPSAQRASLASSVNNHYPSRAFSTFVGSFLEGYSTALMQGGRNQTVLATPTGAVAVQQDAFTPKQMVQAGLGNVGKSMAQNFAQGASRKPTITVKPGADLGVWFVKDAATSGY